MLRPSITKQFAQMLGYVGCARGGALDPATQGFQFGHQMHQRPGGKDCWDGASLSTTEVARALSLSASARTSPDVNVVGSRLAIVRSFLVMPVCL
jgi:hypothetical protein